MESEATETTEWESGAIEGGNARESNLDPPSRAEVGLVLGNVH